MQGLTCVLVLLICSGFSYGQECPVDINPADRRDCFPWPGANQETCEAQGCVWCPLETTEYPWCFPNDLQCPSEIPEDQRIDCHPEPGVTKEACLSRGCLWCNVETPGNPACFFDEESSMGGEFCPAYIGDEERIECWPHDDADVDACLSRHCYWCPSSLEGAPWCFAPPVQGYEMVGDPVATPKGFRVQITKRPFPTWFTADIMDVTVDVEFQENERLRIKIYDPSTQRFEVPLDIESPDSQAPNPLYDITFSNTPSFNFQVIRRGSGEVLFDTSLGGFVFSDQGIQFSTRLPTDNVYGFGETEHHSYKHDMNYKSWGMYSRDQAVTQANLYGVQPFYMALDEGNNAHGVLILNANAQELEMLPAPGFVYRTIGGVLDFYFFLGPSPENVVQQYTEAIGRPYMPPYWSLGFHLSRYGYNSLANLRATVDRMRQYDIPHDCQHGDIDYFDRRLDFTIDPINYAGMSEYVDQIRQEGTYFITILDPCISIGEPPGSYPPFENGEAQDVWVKTANGVTSARGRVWPDDEVYFPDYSKPSCQQWWIDETVAFSEQIAIDGLWIDMNEPASFVTGSPEGCSYNKLNNPLFKPRSVWGDVLADKSVCPDFLQEFGTHYDVHSLYGWSECEPSLRAARAAAGPNKRSIVISRSTFVGAGKFSTHWLGDNFANWDNLYYSIIGMMEFNLFGIPFVGADICGFGGDTTAELCQRWHQLGAFYTFARNHNAINAIDHDPGVFGPEFAANVRKVLHIRYTLLPYLYTLFYEANTRGNTVIRPLLHEFVSDSDTHAIDEQFLWGPALLISPVLREGSEMSYRGEYGEVPAPADVIPLHIRGGYVLPTQQPANCTNTSRNLPMGLIIALNDEASAQGTLFWDEGDTVDTIENSEYFGASYTVSSGSLTASVVSNGYSGVDALSFDAFTVLGQSESVTSVLINGIAWAHYTYDATIQVLYITDLEVSVNSAFSVNWS